MHHKFFCDLHELCRDPETHDASAVRALQRWAWSLGLAACWAAGYLLVGRSHPLASLVNPAVDLDAKIPFLAWSVWPYLLGVVGIALPAVLLRSQTIFRQTAVAYGLVIALSMLCFLLLPVNAATLRQQSSLQHLDGFTAWAITCLHDLDPPTNLLPSLHVSLASLAALSLVRQLPAWRLWIGLCWLLTTLSVLTLKQHYLLDACSGMLLALITLRVSRLNLVSRKT